MTSDATAGPVLVVVGDDTQGLGAKIAHQLRAEGINAVIGVMAVETPMPLIRSFEALALAWDESPQKGAQWKRERNTWKGKKP